MSKNVLSVTHQHWDYFWSSCCWVLARLILGPGCLCCCHVLYDHRFLAWRQCTFWIQVGQQRQQTRTRMSLPPPQVQARRILPAACTVWCAWAVAISSIRHPLVTTIIHIADMMIWSWFKKCHLELFSILTQVWVRACMPEVLTCSLAHLRGLPSCFRKWTSCGFSGHCELAWLRICPWAFQCLSWWSHLDNGEPRMVQLRNDEKLSSWLQFNCVCCCQLAADCFSFSSRQCFDNLF